VIDAACGDATILRDAIRADVPVDIDPACAGGTVAGNVAQALAFAATPVGAAPGAPPRPFLR
jgi:hypothetical protein